MYTIIYILGGIAFIALVVCLSLGQSVETKRAKLYSNIVKYATKMKEDMKTHRLAKDIPQHIFDGLDIMIESPDPERFSDIQQQCIKFFYEKRSCKK